MPTTNRCLFGICLILLSFKAYSQENVVRYQFSNGANLTFYLDRKEVVYSEMRGAQKIISTVLSGKKINRAIENIIHGNKDTVEEENMKPSFIGPKSKNDIYFAMVTNAPGKKMDVTVFEAENELYAVNREGEIFSLKIKLNDPQFKFEKNEAKYVDNSSEVVAHKWLFTGVTGAPSLGALTIYTENSKEFFVLLIGSNGKSIKLSGITKEHRLSFEERYGKVFVELGGNQVEDYDVRELLDNRIIEGKLPVPSSRRNSDFVSGFINEIVSGIGEAISAGAADSEAASSNDFVRKNFIKYEKAHIENKEHLVLPSESFDVEEFNDLRRKLVNGSAIIVGEEGAGKYEFLTRFVKNVLDRKYPEFNEKTHFYDLPVHVLAASDGRVGKTEEKVKQIIEHARLNPDVIFVIGNIHLAKGAGTHSGSDIDIIQMLAPSLAEGSVKIIATTTEDYYKKYFAGDDTFNRGVGKVVKKDAPEDKIPEALDVWAKAHKYEPLSKEAKNLIITISKKFDSSTAYLLRAVGLQADVLAELKISGINVKDLNAALIKKVAARKYNIDERYFDQNQRQEILKQVVAGLNERIAGQKELKEALINDAQGLLTSSSSGKKPLGRRLFFGDRGIGKTFIPEVYAELMGLPFERIKLDENTDAEMIKTRIAQAIRKNGMTVFLIDEVEKTRKGVQNELLDVLDSPVLLAEEALDAHLSSKRTPKYVKYNIGNATFFLATNAGAQTINPNDSFEQVEEKLMADNLSRYVIDRVADLHHFQGPQTEEEFLAVLKIKIKEYVKIKEKEKNTKIYITNQDQILNELTKSYFRPGASYRGAIDDIEKAFQVALAKVEMKHALNQKCSLTLTKIASFRNQRPNNIKKRGMGFTSD